MGGIRLVHRLTDRDARPAVHVRVCHAQGEPISRSGDTRRARVPSFESRPGPASMSTVSPEATSTRWVWNQSPDSVVSAYTKRFPSGDHPLGRSSSPDTATIFRSVRSSNEYSHRPGSATGAHVHQLAPVGWSPIGLDTPGRGVPAARRRRWMRPRSRCRASFRDPPRGPLHVHSVTMRRCHCRSLPATRRRRSADRRQGP